MRLLAGITGLGTTPYTLTGDDRMCARPMKELLDAMSPIGIHAFSGTPDGFPPVTIQGKERQGGTTRLDCSKSSQYLSALLMIGPFMTHGLTIDLTGPPVSSPYIDLTMDVMKQFQVTACRINDTTYQVPGGQQYILETMWWSRTCPMPVISGPPAPLPDRRSVWPISRRILFREI